MLPVILNLGFWEEVVPEPSAGGSCSEGRVMHILGAGSTFPCSASYLIAPHSQAPLPLTFPVGVTHGRHP